MGVIDAFLAPRLLKRAWDQQDGKQPVKRFWKAVDRRARKTAASRSLLDGRPVRTPARAPLVVPTEALAEAIAEEWRASGRRSIRARCR